MSQFDDRLSQLFLPSVTSEAKMSHINVPLSHVDVTLSQMEASLSHL
jgi:hypothetical protein